MGVILMDWMPSLIRPVKETNVILLLLQALLYQR
jgi:hypothetical protein